MSGSDYFKFQIQKLLRSQVAVDWYNVKKFKFEVSTSGQLKTNIRKNGNFIHVSLWNSKFPDDPIVRFYTPSHCMDIIEFYDIQYLSGITLLFYSSVNLDEYDIRPEDLNEFLESWADILISL